MTWFRITLLGTLAAFLLPALAAVAGDTGPYLAGRLLVAAPQLGDPRFQETVIYIVSHNTDGAFGLVVNRSLGSGPINKLFEGFGIDTEGTETESKVHLVGLANLFDIFIFAHGGKVRSLGLVGGALPGAKESSRKRNHLFMWNTTLNQSNGDWIFFIVPHSPDIIIRPSGVYTTR